MSIAGNVYDSSMARLLQARAAQTGKSVAFAVEHYTNDANHVLNIIGRDLGINQNKNDEKLSIDKYISAQCDRNDLLFQGNDGVLYNLNFTTGQTSEQAEDEWIEENYGGLILENQETGEKDLSDRLYDIVDFGRGTAELINYAFTGTGDGVHEFSANAYDAFPSNTSVAKWGDNVQWVYREVDTTNPSSDFLRNMSENRAKYISTEEANNAYLEGGYSNYVMKLLLNVIRSMSHNDAAGSAIMRQLEALYG